MVTVSGNPNPRQNIVFVYATRIILQCELHNVSGIAVNTLLVGYPNPNPTTKL